MQLPITKVIPVKFYPEFWVIILDPATVLGTTPILFEKFEFEFSMQNLMLNRLVLISNLKYENQKSSYPLF